MEKGILHQFLADPSITAILNAIKHWPGTWVSAEHDDLMPLATHYVDALNKFAVAAADKSCGTRPVLPVGFALTSDPLAAQRQAQMIIGGWQPVSDWRKRRERIWRQAVAQGVRAFQQITLAQVRQSPQWDKISSVITPDVLAVDRHLLTLECTPLSHGDELHVSLRVRNTISRSAPSGLDLDALIEARVAPRRRSRRQRKADAQLRLA